MNFHIMTLFPDMVEQGLKTSIIGRAEAKGLLSIDAVNIRDYAFNKHQSVDDYPYGGGAGMLMQAEPVFQCYEAVCQKTKASKEGKRPRLVYLSPQGRTFNQEMAEEFAKEDELILLCGHYEGIDERVLEEIVTDYVSIGDYVLTGGELAAMVMIDAISRSFTMMFRQSLRVFRITFWNTRSIPGRRRGTENRCRRYFFPVIMRTLKSGEGNSQLSGLLKTGRICLKKQNLRKKSRNSSKNIEKTACNPKDYMIH